MSDLDDITTDDATSTGVGRRGFLAAGAGAFLCTIGGEKVLLAGRGDAAKADAAAARVKRPAFASATAPKAPIGSDPVDKLTFVTPGPQSGGVEREYWIQATSALWDIVPSRPRRDLWHGVAIPGPTVFRAVMYQEMTEGFAAPKGPAAIPGPILHCEVGDVLKVHFRNALPEKLNQAVTMHPHGVRYNPEYDGVYLGDFTRAGGFIAPGEEFTYTWEALPDSVGVWPYHDHGPNHTLNTMRGLFGGLIVTEKGAKAPDVEEVLFFHMLAAAEHRPGARIPVHQRARLRRQHADAAREGRAGRRAARHRDGQQLPRLPHPRTPLAQGRKRDLHRRPRRSGRTRARRRASSRTTRAAGSITATSSPIRTRG